MLVNMHLHLLLQKIGEEMLEERCAISLKHFLDYKTCETLYTKEIGIAINLHTNM